MPVVDAHVHIFPEEIVRHRERYLERDRWFGMLYASPRARLAAADDLVASMDESDVDLSVACGFPWRDPGLCEFHNEYMCESAARFPDRIAWLAICSPQSGASAARTLHAAFDLGARGVGELNADAQGFDLDNPQSLWTVAEACITRNRPAMFHVSEPLGHDYPGKGYSTPQRLLNLLTAYPALRVVAAHWGGGLPFYELMPEIRVAAANVVYDSAASTYLYDHQVFEAVTDLVGEDRVLFASDYPVLKQGPLLAKCRRQLGARAVLSKVAGENAIRIFGLEEMIG